MKPATYPAPRVVEWQNSIKSAELACERAIALTLDMPDAKRIAAHATLTEAHKRIRKAHAAALEYGR